MSKIDVLNYLEENYGNLTESQRVLGEYILNHYREAAFLSAVELGEKLGLSDATVIRFARALGFSGFAEFKASIQESIKKQESPDTKLLRNLKNFKHKDDVISEVCSTDIKNLEAYLLNNEGKKMDAAVELIYQVDTIYCVGLGSSVVIADFLSYHMRRMGFKVICIGDGGLVLFEKLASITEKDLLIVATFPRYSKDTLNAMLLSKKKGAKIIGITDNSFTEIGRNSDIVLEAKTRNSGFFNSYVVPMELCNILIFSILERDRERIYQNIKANIDWMEELDLFI
ncbi:MAG: MurR/RpiR family transcriptional regulator [Thermotaleaceae bacterium]